MLLSQEEFITKAVLIHGTKYDYSLSNYNGYWSNVNIVCNTCGITFQQTPMAHISRGRGCKNCNNSRRIEILHNRDDQTSFVNKSILKHGDRYDYSLVCYKNSLTKVVIRCKKHGIFTQTPNNHLAGKGCNTCSLKVSAGEWKLLNFLREQFPDDKILHQYRPEWLKVNKNIYQSLDIYFPDYNIAVEYQGRQHFEPVDFFGGLKGFNDNLARDSVKNKKCAENKCVLLYFTFLEKFANSHIFCNKKLLIAQIKTLTNEIRL